MKTKTLILSVVLIVFVIGGMTLITDRATGSAIQALTAVKIAKAPATLDDDVWQKAKALDVPFDGKEKFAGMKAVVTTRALYTDDEIFFLFKWKDDTQSVTKGAWQFDGEKWNRLKGDTITYRMPKKLSGSRGVIQALSRFADGGWSGAG
jgi:hypothetical protein